jgi:polyhydroxyalkanoate synthase
MMGEKPELPWEDLFFELDGSTAETSDTAQRVYGRYVRAGKLIIDSLNASVGLTPKETVWALNKSRLYHYLPTRPIQERYPVPLLLVYALINKPFIFDLAPRRSFIEYMLEQGFEVYLLDWGEPGPEDINTTFEDYVTEYLYRAVRRMLSVSKAREFSMLGYCLGATLATLYTALYTEFPLRNLILLTAPIDFSEKPTGSMAMWLEEKNLDVDKLVDTLGNVPGELIRHWAKMLKPVENFMGAYINLWKIMHDADAVRGWQAINRWVEDVVPVAGEAFRQFVKIYFRGNNLVNGEHSVKGRKVDPVNIKANLLNIVAEYDHLVARSQAENLMDRVSSQDKTLKVIPSTHVGIMAGGRAQYKLWPEIAEWLAPRSTVAN